MGILNIQVHQEDDFIYQFNHLKEKYGSDFQYLNGFHESQLDFSRFIAGFVDSGTVADTTIDGNANAKHKDICSLRGEKGKSEDKLFAFNKIYYELKKKYGKRTADQWLEDEWTGQFYMHDAPSSTYTSYCFAYDLSRLAREGLFFLDDYHNEPPQHLTTFIDDTIEFISFFSNRTSGACGLPNILVWAMYFWKKDIEDDYCLKNPDYYLRQAYQKFIFRINQPFLRVDQSAFVNVSIFDRYYYESLFGGLEFPDGTFAIDYVDEFIRQQKIFMEVVSEIRSVNNMFTFPVLSYSLLKRDDLTKKEMLDMIKTKDYHIFKDNEFARWCSDHNCEWYDSNFFMSTDVTTLSNCCRLLSNTTKLSGFINSIGGTALSIGSVKVSTINLMRIALESDKDEEKYLKILRDKTILDCKVLDRQRWIIKRNIQKGLLPNFCEGGVELDKCYSTIGKLIA
jgi:ribonucleoside-triphosphate reductase